MKTLRYIFTAGVLMSALCTGLVACNEPKDPELQGEDVPFTVYSSGEETPGEEVPDMIIDPSFFVTPHGEVKVAIINSVEELQEYLCDDYYPEEYPYPSINFETRTLLLVGGKAFANVFYSAIRSFQYFPSGKYKLEVELALTPLLAWGPNWCIPVLTDKISGDAKIEVSIIDVSQEKIETIQK